MNFPLDIIDQETKELLRDFTKELKVLNENLSDLKEMIAPYLGFRVKEKKEVEG